MAEALEPGHMPDAFADAWNRHDVQAFAALFTDDADFVNVVGMWWRSRGEIEGAHAATHSTIFRNSRLTAETSSVKELRPGVKAVHAIWELTGAEAPDGTPAGTRRGILLLVLTHEDVGWRIKVAQNTDIVPDAVAPPRRAGR